MPICGKLEDGSTGLLPHSYEKTLIAINRNTLIYVEGSNFKPSFTDKKGHINNSFFGTTSEKIGTNSGVRLTKEQLLEIADNMKEGATLCISAEDFIGLSGYRLNLIKEEFARDNDMVQVGPCAFTPSRNVSNEQNGKK
jgi:hypothetical protein